MPGPAAWFRWIVPLTGVVLLGVLFVQLGPARILSLLGAMGPNLLVVILIFAGHECVRALALSRCLVPGHRPAFGRLIWIRLFGEAVRILTHTGPFVSEPARAWMLARQGLQGAHAYGAAVSEFIANSAVSALVAVVVLQVALRTVELAPELVVLAHGLVWFSLAYAGVVVVALALRVYAIGAILRGVSALPLVGRRLRTDPVQVRRMEDAILHVLRDRPAILGQVVVLELTAQALLVLEIYWALRSMGLSLTAGTALLIEALTKLANVVQFVGATEGGYALVLNWLGMTAAVGFTLSLVKRVRSLAIAVVGIGLMTLGRSTWALAPGASAEPPR